MFIYIMFIYIISIQEDLSTRPPPQIDHSPISIALFMSQDDLPYRYSKSLNRPPL